MVKVQQSTVSVLINNTARPDDLIAEHGLSLFVEIGSVRILFDTGQTQALLHNATRMDINLADVNSIVLSHGHYDHTGGLQHVLDAYNITEIYAHPDAFQAKYVKRVSSKYIGSPVSPGFLTNQKRCNVFFTSDAACLHQRAYLTGEVPRLTHFEDVGGPFFLDVEATKPDRLLDDQALYFETSNGWVVLLGCAHAGVINTLRHISQLHNIERFCAVVGGMHLVGASQDRIDKTIQALRDFDIDLIAPLHCSGPDATAQIANAFGSRYRELAAGDSISF